MNTKQLEAENSLLTGILETVRQDLEGKKSPVLKRSTVEMVEGGLGNGPDNPPEKPMSELTEGDTIELFDTEEATIDLSGELFVPSTAPHPAGRCPGCDSLASGSFYVRGEDDDDEAAARCLNCLHRWRINPNTGKPLEDD